MKKLIAILAVFAFLGAALFAQDAGTWTIGGSGQINTRISFMNLYKADLGAPNNYAQVGASNYGDGGSFSDGDVKGSLTLGYTKGIIKAEVSFNQRGKIGANFQASGENFQFRASRDLLNLLAHDAFGSGNITLDLDVDGDGTVDGDATGTFPGWAFTGFGDLWGNYTFQVLEGIFVEAAYNKEGSLWEQGFDSWTHHDRLSKNYLLVNVKPMAGLEFGFKMPDLYQYTPRDFMDDVLRRIVFGAKYSVSPITVAFQFGLNNYGTDWTVIGGNGGTFNQHSNRIYFGAKYDIAPGIDAGVYFRGEFGYKAYLERGNDETPKADPKTIDNSAIVFGGSFNYASGPLGAGLTFRFNDSSTAGTADAPKYRQDQWFRLGITARYDVLPDNLRAKLAFELEFPILGEELAKTRKDLPAREDSPKYTFTPEITYNFLGTGAGDDPGVGMRIKYSVSGRFEAVGALQGQNELTIAFKWSF